MNKQFESIEFHGNRKVIQDYKKAMFFLKETVCFIGVYINILNVFPNDTNCIKERQDKVRLLREIIEFLGDEIDEENRAALLSIGEIK